MNILALTSSDEAVLIRQYRHGTRAIVTEIPGGMIDDGEQPIQAARRELQEETGFTAKTWVRTSERRKLNPAIQSNHCHMFLALRRAERSAPSSMKMKSLKPLPCPSKTFHLWSTKAKFAMRSSLRVLAISLNLRGGGSDRHSSHYLATKCHPQFEKRGLAYR